MGNRLNKIGWEHLEKPEAEILRLFELQILLKSGKHDDATRCLLYAGFLTVDGYGFNKGFVHRRRWQLENPDVTLTRDIQVRHKCPNRHCFAIEHLEIGNALDNCRDKRRDGTENIGEKNGNAKLMKDIAQKIKNNYHNETQKARANRYNISPMVVSNIDRGTSWGDLPYRGQPDVRRETIAEKIYEARQRLKHRIPNTEDYENVWKRIQHSSNESLTEIYNDIPCLLFQKTRNYGYGTISFLGSMKRTHIVVWEKFHNNCQRQDDKTKVIRHLCGNRACCQPSHLKLGTHTENAGDRRKHGTQRSTSEAQAREIWRLGNVEGLNPKQISEKLGINRKTISGILSKRRHLYIHEFRKIK